MNRIISQNVNNCQEKNRGLREKILNIQEILDRLEDYLAGYKGFKKGRGSVAKLAKYLEVSPNIISTWKARRTIPHDKLVAICEQEGLNPAWLLIGEGEMFLPGKGPGGKLYDENGPYVCFAEEEGGDQGQKAISKDEYTDKDLKAMIDRIKQTWREAKKYGLCEVILDRHGEAEEHVWKRIREKQQECEAHLEPGQDRPHQGG